MISIVVAVDNNYVIGRNGGLPWPNISADMLHFKALTTGKTIVMGRKTFESIGRPLPERTNIVLTRDESFVAEGVKVMHSVAEVVAYAHNKEVFIIGGADVFSQFLPVTHAIHLTRIAGFFEGDTHFQEKWLANFELADSKTERDLRTGYQLKFEVYKRG